MERGAVRLRINGDGRDAELAQRAEDPDRDLTAVGNQHLSEWRHGRPYCVTSMHFADQLTLARAFSVPLVVVLYAWDFPNHYYWATAVFAIAMATDYVDGWWARRTNRSSNLGRLLDPVADKLLVMAALIMLVGVALPA